MLIYSKLGGVHWFLHFDTEGLSRGHHSFSGFLPKAGFTHGMMHEKVTRRTCEGGLQLRSSIGSWLDKQGACKCLASRGKLLCLACLFFTRSLPQSYFFTPTAGFPRGSLEIIQAPWGRNQRKGIMAAIDPREATGSNRRKCLNCVATKADLFWKFWEPTEWDHSPQE